MTQGFFVSCFERIEQDQKEEILPEISPKPALEKKRPHSEISSSSNSNGQKKKKKNKNKKKMRKSITS